MRHVSKSSQRSLLVFATVACVGACKMDLDYLSAGDGTAGSAGLSGATSVGGSFGGSGVSSSSGSSSGGTFSSAGTSEPNAGGEGDQGGSSTSGGSGGSGGDAGGPTNMPSLELTTVDGRISADSNDFGIDGEWRKFGADMTLLETNFTGNKICIKGSVTQWGGGIQLVLHRSPTDGAPGTAYNSVVNKFAGLKMVIEGKDIPANGGASVIKVKFKQVLINDDFCQTLNLFSGAAFSLPVSKAVRNCQGTSQVDPTQLENFEIHIVPTTATPVTLDFCLRNVTVMPAE